MAGMNQYAYEQPYLTPFPSSTVEPQQWNQYARASISDINMSTYPMAQPSSLFHAPIQHAPGRPRSSPSTFGPSPESLEWTPSAGLGIQYSAANGQPTPLTSTFPPTAFPAYATELPFETPSPPQLQQPQPRRPYQSIAPNPAGVTAAKRQRDEDEAAAFAAGESRPPSGNKRRRTTSAAADTLSDDDRLLIQLRETEALPWKDIAARFSEGKDELHTTARLQMKYKRLRQRFRVWEEQDLYALKAACEYYERCKWQIISAKVCASCLENIIIEPCILTLITRCSSMALQNDGHLATVNKNGASFLPWRRSLAALRWLSTPVLWRHRWHMSVCLSSDFAVCFPQLRALSPLLFHNSSYFLLGGQCLSVFSRCCSMIPTFASENRIWRDRLLDWSGWHWVFSMAGTIDAGRGNKGRGPHTSFGGGILPHMYIKIRRDNINENTSDENTSWGHSCHFCIMFMSFASYKQGRCRCCLTFLARCASHTI
jgi:hypothetical protein